MSQQALDIFAAVPSSTGTTRYIPLLLDRPGERRALEHADDETWACMTPLVAVTAWGGQPTADTLKSRARKLQMAVGEHRFYLDLAGIRPNRRIVARGSKRRTLEVLHDEVARRGLSFLPVARPNDGPQRLEVVARAVREHGRGIALRHRLGSRIQRSGEGPADRLLRTIDVIGTQPEHVDLILDLGWLDPDASAPSRWIARQIQALSASEAWRTVALAGTCVPKSVSDVASADDIGSTPRAEWALWKEVDAATDINLAFGDYAVQHPRVPSKGGRAYGNLRYTTESDLYVSRGRLLSNMDVGDFAEMCRRITAGRFSGSDFSWGDEQIQAIAQLRRSSHSAIYDEPDDDDTSSSTEGMGGSAFWRGVGTSHHLRLVTEQLVSHRSPSR